MPFTYNYCYYIVMRVKVLPSFSFLFFFFGGLFFKNFLIIIIILFYFIILYWFCHTSTCIHHGCTCVPQPELPSHLPPQTIPLGHPSAPAPSFLHLASNLNWWFISYIHFLYDIIHVLMPFSQIIPPSQSPKDCSIHLCLLCCLTYGVVVTIFLNSIYMH